MWRCRVHARLEECVVSKREDGSKSRIARNRVQVALFLALIVGMNGQIGSHTVICEPRRRLQETPPRTHGNDLVSGRNTLKALLELFRRHQSGSRQDGFLVQRIKDGFDGFVVDGSSLGPSLDTIFGLLFVFFLHWGLGLFARLVFGARFALWAIGL